MQITVHLGHCPAAFFRTEGRSCGMQAGRQTAGRCLQPQGQKQEGVSMPEQGGPFRRTVWWSARECRQALAFLLPFSVLSHSMSYGHRPPHPASCLGGVISSLFDLGIFFVFCLVLLLLLFVSLLFGSYPTMFNGYSWLLRH